MQWKKRHNEFCKFRHGARLLANVVVGVNYRSFGVLSMSLDILANECFFFFISRVLWSIRVTYRRLLVEKAVL